MADTMSQNPPPIDISILACGLGDRTFGWKIPRVHLVPLNVGQIALRRSIALRGCLPVEAHRFSLILIHA
jgi:hypothetical protein